MTTGFFSAIQPYAIKADLTIMVNQMADGKMNVIMQIKPKDAKASPELAKVLNFKGTPEELDTELVKGLPKIAASYVSLSETLESIRLIEEQQKKDAAEKAANKKTTKSAAALPSGKAATAPLASSAGEDEDEDEGGDGETSAPTVPTPAAAKAIAPATNLFGDE